MSIAISNYQPQAAAPASAQPVAQQSSASAAPAKPQAPVQDSVQISSLAQAARKEAIESPAQTAHEAATGDIQAKHLLAREQAANKA